MAKIPKEVQEFMQGNRAPAAGSKENMVIYFVSFSWNLENPLKFMRDLYLARSRRYIWPTEALNMMWISDPH